MYIGNLLSAKRSLTARDLLERDMHSVHVQITGDLEAVQWAVAHGWHSVGMLPIVCPIEGKTRLSLSPDNLVKLAEVLGNYTEDWIGADALLVCVKGKTGRVMLRVTKVAPPFPGSDEDEEEEESDTGQGSLWEPERRHKRRPTGAKAKVHPRRRRVSK